MPNHGQPRALIGASGESVEATPGAKCEPGAFLGSGGDTAPSGASDGPLVVLVEENPWLEILGSDMPRFALYEDGRVIYRRERGLRGFRQCRLDSAAVHSLLAACCPEDVIRFEGSYQTCDVSDLRTYHLWRWLDGVRHEFEVYGYLDDERVRSQFPQYKEWHAKIPPAILRAIEGLLCFDVSSAAPWVPQDVEALLVRAVDESGTLPEPLPLYLREWDGNYNAPAQRQVLRLFAPAAHLDALVSFLSSDRRPLLHCGERWLVNGVRLPFPYEELWMGRFWMGR